MLHDIVITIELVVRWSLVSLESVAEEGWGPMAAEGRWRSAFGGAMLLGLLTGCGSEPEVTPAPVRSTARETMRCPLPLIRGSTATSLPGRLRISNSTGEVLDVFLDLCLGHRRLGQVTDGETVFMALPRFLYPYGDGIRIHTFVLEDELRYGSYIVPFGTGPIIEFEVSSQTAEVAYPTLAQMREAGAREEMEEAEARSAEDNSRQGTGEGAGAIPGAGDRTTGYQQPVTPTGGEALGFDFVLSETVGGGNASTFSEDGNAVLAWTCQDTETGLQSDAGVPGAASVPGEASLRLYVRGVALKDPRVAIKIDEGRPKPVMGWTVAPFRPHLVLQGDLAGQVTKDALDRGSLVFMLAKEETGWHRWSFPISGLREALPALPCFLGWVGEGT